MIHLLAILLLSQSHASTYNVHLHDSDNRAYVKVPVTLGEYRTTWLGGTTNKFYSQKTDQSGQATLSYKEDQYHYFDTVLCVELTHKEVLCKGLSSIYGPEVMCFSDLKGNKM